MIVNRFAVGASIADPVAQGRNESATNRNALGISRFVPDKIWYE